MDYPPITIEDGGQTLKLVIALCGAALGAALLLAGARFSRSLVTLTAVALGALVGRELPHRLGWTVSPMGPTVALALTAGVLAFWLHRVWLAVLLGGILAGWFAAVLLLVTVPKEQWPAPAVEADSTVQSVGRGLWDQLPAATRRALPFVAGAGLITGLAFIIRWPRLGAALAYSLLGMTLLTVMGGYAVQVLQPQWLDRLPPGLPRRLGLIAAGTVAATLLQWLLLPAPPAAPAADAGEDDSEETDE